VKIIIFFFSTFCKKEKKILCLHSFTIQIDTRVKAQLNVFLVADTERPLVIDYWWIIS